jgi:hypothetical protein
MSRFAMGVVIDGDNAREVWKDVSATLGDGNNLLEEGHSCVFVGGPYAIAEAEEYDSLDVGQTILRGEFGAEPVPHKDEPAAVTTVDVTAREDGLYLFADDAAARAFADAAESPHSPSPVVVDDPPVNLGKGAEGLIASERAALMEDADMPTLAEDVRAGLIGLETLLIRLSSIPDTAAARGLLGHWIVVDSARTIPEEARRFNLASADSVEEGDWIALGEDDDKPTEPRKVKGMHVSGVQIIFVFEDDDPPAKFNYDDLLWHRVGDEEV